MEGCCAREYYGCVGDKERRQVSNSVTQKKNRVVCTCSSHQDKGVTNQYHFGNIFDPASHATDLLRLLIFGVARLLLF